MPGPPRLCAGGSAHTLAICCIEESDDASRGIVAFGRATNGRLGRDARDGGRRGEQRVPLRVHEAEFGEPIGEATAVVAGAKSSLLLTTEGEVFAFGGNSDGQLGLGDTADRELPTRLAAFSGLPVCDIATGKEHSLFTIAGSGELYSCGHSADGKLGHPDLEDFDVPGGGVCVDAVEDVPRMVRFQLRGIRVARVATGERHSLCATTEGELYSFGCAEDGRLGHGPDLALQLQPRVVAYLQHRVFVTDVAAGAQHSLALSDEGAVRAFGKGEGGRLGLGDEESQLLPREVPLRRLRPLRRPPQGVVRWVHAEGEPPRGAVVWETHVGGGAAQAPSRGEGGSGGEEEDGAVLWGTDGQEEKEDWSEAGGPSPRVVVISAGGRHTALVTEEGELHTCGVGSQGQLGHGDLEPRLRPTPVDELRSNRVLHAAAGAAHTCVLVALGRDGEECAAQPHQAIPQAIPQAFGFGVHGQTGNGRLDMAPQCRRPGVGSGAWRDGESQVGTLIPLLRPVPELVPRRCAPPRMLDEEEAANSASHIKSIERPPQVSLYEVWQQGGNGKWFKGQVYETPPLSSWHGH